MIFLYFRSNPELLLVKIVINCAACAGTFLLTRAFSHLQVNGFLEAQVYQIMGLGEKMIYYS